MVQRQRLAGQVSLLQLEHRMKAALRVLPRQEQLLMLMARLLLVAEQLDRKAHKALRVNKESKVNKDQQGLLVQLVQQVQQDHRVQRVQQVLMVLTVLMVLLDLKDRKVPLDLRVHKAIKV
tara:strand:+ start:47 stop:409 length:363 start_codon:yes stop_codon:yes gene_type:complete